MHRRSPTFRLVSGIDPSKHREILDQPTKFADLRNRLMVAPCGKAAIGLQIAGCVNPRIGQITSTRLCGFQPQVAGCAVQSGAEVTRQLEWSTQPRASNGAMLLQA